MAAQTVLVKNLYMYGMLSGAPHNSCSSCSICCSGTQLLCSANLGSQCSCIQLQAQRRCLH